MRFASVRLREDIKTQSAELVSLQARLRDSQAKLSEVQSKELPTQFELTKIAHERDSLQKKVVLLEEELQKRLKEERVVRSDLNDKQYQLERMTKDREADAEQHRLEVSSLQVMLLVLTSTELI